MADVTRFKDLQESQKRLEAENLKREVMEKKLQDQIESMGAEMKEHVNSKFDLLNTAISNMQLQFQNINKGKGVMEESILGEPPSHLKFEAEQYKPQSAYKYRSHSENYHHHLSNSPPRVDFPIFDGTNPRAWIVKCNTYFKIVKNVDEDQKVSIASMYFEGKAALWYHSVAAENHDVTWTQFVEMLSSRFEELKKAQIVDDFN